MTNRKLPDHYLDLLHTPADAAAERVAWAEKMKDAPGVTFGIPAIDKHLIPMHPGDVCVFVARPAHGKTSMLAYLAKKEAERIVARGKNTIDGDCVVYLSWEQITEEIDSLFQVGTHSATDIVRGNVDLDEVRANAIERAGLPIWLIGDSIAKTSIDTPRMTTNVIWKLVEYVKAHYGLNITLLCADYLQLCPVERARDIAQEVTHAAGLLKELAKRCACPTAIAVQARQEVDDYRIPLPRSRDAQWSSRIYQMCDKWFGLWRPWITHKDKGNVPINGKNIPITENLFVMQKLKERFNETRRTWPLFFQPEYLKLAALESEAKAPVYV